MIDGKIQVLLVTGRVTIEHDYRKANELLRTLLESTGYFDVRITEEFRGVTKETLNDYDVVLINYDGKKNVTDKTVTFGVQAEAALLDFVKQGKGAVFYHSSVWLDDDWSDEYHRLIGGYCSMAKGSRKNPKSDAMVDMINTEHPIARGMARQWMAVEDDFFAGVFWHPQASATVLTTVCDDISDYIHVPGFADPYQPAAAEFDASKLCQVNSGIPVAWINHYGQGRTFTTSLGHSDGTVKRVNYLTMFVRGVEWAATGRVTLDFPDRSGDRKRNPWPFYRPEDYAPESLARQSGACR